MSSSPVFVHRPAMRIGALGVVVFLLTVLWAPAAGAAPALTIPLDPAGVMVALTAVENEGLLDVSDPDAESPLTAVNVEWTGTAELQLPAGYDGSTMDVDLELAPNDTDPPTRTYSTTTPGPNGLVVTDLGGGAYSVALPADDAVNGPVGYLTFDGITSDVGAEVTVLPLTYSLEFTGTGALAQPLTTQVVAIAPPPCAFSPSGPCDAHQVPVGGEFALTVPSGSLLRALGLGTLDTVALALQPVDEDGLATEDPAIELESGAADLLVAAAEVAEAEVAEASPGTPAPDVPALSVDQAAAAVTLPASIVPTSPYNATVTLPADVPAGPYSLVVLEGAAPADGVSMSFVPLEVLPLPTPTPGNPGLRSETGWDEPAPFALGSSSPLAAVGAGLLLAGVLGVVAVRQGRRTGTSAE